MAVVTFKLAEFTSNNDLQIIVENIERTILDVESSTEQIAGRRGHYFEGNQIGAKVFSISCFVPANSETERVQIGQNIAHFFSQLSDGNLYTVYFSDEPEIFYWVYPTNISTMQRAGDGFTDGQFSFDLVAPEGLGYGVMESYEIDDPIVNIIPNGNADAPPIIILNTENNLQEIAVSNGEQYVHIGKDVEAADDLFYLNDKLSTLTGWQKLTSNTSPFDIQDGIISDNADVKAGLGKITIDSYGTNPNGVTNKLWYGAARQKTFGKQLENFEVWFSIEFYNKYPRAFNKLDLYFLDEFGQRAARLWIKDEGVSLKNIIGIELMKDDKRKQIALSGTLGLDKEKKGSTKAKVITIKKAAAKATTTTTVAKTASTKKASEVGKVVSKTYSLSQDTTKNTITNFIGQIGLRKIGTKYTAFVQFMDVNGKPYGRRYNLNFRDHDGEFGQAISSMAFYFGKKNIKEDELNVSYEGNFTSIRQIRVTELTVEGTKKEKYVATKGDEIIIDCGNKTVYRNGSVYMENLTIGSQFFKLQTDQENLLAFEPAPDDKNIWSLDVSPRYE